MEEIIGKFARREVRAKEIFTIKEIDKNTAFNFIRVYHYLADAKFFSCYNYGLFIEDELVGVATYSNPQGIVALKGWFGLENSCKNILELSRLCMLPILNGSNATSYLLGGSIKLLKQKDIRAVITLADNSRHIGSIYQVCNFKYYGLTDAKTDFFRFDGKVNPRGSTKDIRGVWLPRTRKHRYAFIMDKTLECKYKELEKPKKEEKEFNGEIKCEFCDDTGEVYDKRFNECHTCPKCKEKESEN